MSSDTPRVDAEDWDSASWDSPAKRMAVDADFARTLERELNAANKSFLAQHAAAVEYLTRAEKAEAERDALREDAERYRYAKKYLHIGVMHYDPQAECYCDFDPFDDAAVDAVRKRKR